ncbi:MAG TPA: CAP domain-containing protein [Blastocatellia bacterium]|nr:CAP domain-containing protein [Blastocatellia bacterium]
MRKRFGLSFSIAALMLALLPPFEARAYSQQSGGVFVGRGQVANRGSQNDRAGAPRAGRGDSYPGESSPKEDELKPMVADRGLREIESLEEQCLGEVNRVRKAHNLVPLELSEELLGVARDYSRRMAEEGFFAHNDPDGRTVRERVARANIKWHVVGENLAYSNGYINPVAASMSGWMDSPGHRRNILDPDWRQTAIGAWISANGTVYFTEIFLRQ